jgi:hypothetical protein
MLPFTKASARLGAFDGNMVRIVRMTLERILASPYPVGTVSEWFYLVGAYMPTAKTSIAGSETTA